MSWKQTAKEPNEDSDTESLSSQASPPVLSNIAGYNLAKDNITHVLDVQKLRLWQAIKAEKERKKLPAIEAALRIKPAAVWRIVKLIGLLMFKTYWLQVVSTHIGLARAAAILTLSQLSLSWNLDWTTRLTLPYKCLGWAVAECFYMKPENLQSFAKLWIHKYHFMYELTTEIWVMLILNSLQRVYMPYFTTEFITLNSEYWILILFSVMNSYQVYEFRLDTWILFM